MLNRKPGDLSDAVCAILNVQWEAVRERLARDGRGAQSRAGPSVHVRGQSLWQSTRPRRGAVRERRHASSRTPAPTSFILSGEMEEECIMLDEDGKIVKTRTKVDPPETLWHVLYDCGLDDVRSVLE